MSQFKIFAIVFGIGGLLSILSTIVMRRRVIRFVRDKYESVVNLSVCWTLFGPIAPGSGNVKFYVRFSDGKDAYYAMYAITSLFGDIFLRDE
jgi:hypothetical protein